MTPQEAQLITVLFDDGCGGCVNSWLIPNFGFILLFIIFVLPFLLVIGVSLSLSLIVNFVAFIYSVIARKPYSWIEFPHAPLYAERYRPNRTSHSGEPIYYNHGQEVRSFSLKEYVDAKGAPLETIGRVKYWDWYTHKFVDSKDLLTKPNLVDSES